MQRNLAAMTKVRAIYGRRVTASDYEAMLQKNTVGDLAGYLKRETDYADQLREVREDLIHRGQLEHLVRRRKLDVYLRLSLYAHSNDTILRLFIMRSEIEQLLAALRSVDTGAMSHFASSFPAHLAKYMSFDLFSLASIKDFKDLLRVLEHTPYHALLLPFRDRPGKERDILSCERELLSFYYKEALALADRRYRGETRRILREFFLSQADLHNLMVIYRLKRYRGAGRETVEKYLLRPEQTSGSHLKAYDSLMDASDASELLARIKDIPLPHGFPPNPGHDMELALSRYRKKASLRAFRFSQRPVIVVLCYMAMLDIEIGNIINIIEGVRYGLPADEIRRLLVI